MRLEDSESELSVGSDESDGSGILLDLLREMEDQVVGDLVLAIAELDSSLRGELPILALAVENEDYLLKVFVRVRELEYEVLDSILGFLDGSATEHQLSDFFVDEEEIVPVNDKLLELGDIHLDVLESEFLLLDLLPLSSLLQELER